jgi:hypothetical protein
MTKARDSWWVLRGPHATFNNRVTLRAGAKSQKFGRCDQESQDLQPYLRNPIGQRTRICNLPPAVARCCTTEARGLGESGLRLIKKYQTTAVDIRQTDVRLGCVAWDMSPGSPLGRVCKCLK